MTLLETNLGSGSIPKRQGKVRDVYDLGDRLLLVATDRISAFDWVLLSGIPDKGRVLTQTNLHWLGTLRGTEYPLPAHRRPLLAAGGGGVVAPARPPQVGRPCG